jgi:energy-coupling factor transport system ATP-binding protein
MTFLIVETTALRYAYRSDSGAWVLDGMNLHIGPGEYVLVCGASGAGKSTLCRTFNGLIPHFYGGVFQGEVRVAGVSTAAQSVADLFAQVGIVFQNPEAQLFNQTVEREIAFGLESLGLPRVEIKERIAHSAETVGIAGLLLRHPHELSGGEQQLASIAAVLALRPQLMVLDEPYANLDPVHVRRVRAALREIQRQGIAIVVSEHRLQHAVTDVGRMVVMAQGRIVLDGPPREVLVQDVEVYGLNLPLPVRIGRRLGLSPLPLDVAAVATADPAPPLPADLRPVSPAPPESGATPVLEVENLSFVQNGVSILSDVSFRLHAGECLAVVGANGAGKTTLLKQLNGLVRPTAGRVRVVGQDTDRTRVSEMARYVGVAFQNPNSQFFKLAVWDEIMVGAKALDRYDEAWLQELVQLLGLEPLLERAPYRLSEGEKKRVAFAAALAAQPAVLALDEPTAGQDWHFQRALADLLAALRAGGRAIVLATHDLAFAQKQAHRWLLLAGGQVVAEGPPAQVMADEAAMRRANLEPTQAVRLYSQSELVHEGTDA